MTTTTSQSTRTSNEDRTVPQADVDEFAEKIFGSLLGAFDTAICHIGTRLGLYRSLAEEGDASARDLAARLGFDTRYVREWLEHQAVAGNITCADPESAPDERTFHLPPAHAEVLVDDMSTSFMAPFPRLFMAVSKQTDDLCEAFRTGEGISWETQGDEARRGQADANRPLFLRQLGPEYLASLPDVDRRLQAGGRVADLGCGFGWSAIGVALAYPNATVVGFDIDRPSIEAARLNADLHGVSDRVEFREVDARKPVDETGFDLVMALECVHDLSDPVGFLSTMRRLAGDDGVVIVMDERVGETFTGQADPVEEMFYGFSLLCCLPDGRCGHHSAATGTVMRPGTLAKYAEGAGFAGVDVLDLDHDFFRFYRLQHG